MIRFPYLVLCVANVFELPVNVVPRVQTSVEHRDPRLAPVLLLQVLDRQRNGTTVAGQGRVGARRADERAALLRRRRRRRGRHVDQVSGGDRSDGTAIGSGIHGRLAVAEVRERRIRVLLLLLQWIMMMTLWKVSFLHHRREWLMVVLLLLLHWNMLLLVVRIHRLVSGVRRRRRRGRDRRPVLPLTLLVGQRPGGLLGSAHVVPAEGDQLFPRRGEAGGGLERLKRLLFLNFVVARFLG